MTAPPKQIPLDQHNVEIHENLDIWERKPALRWVYRNFYELIRLQVQPALPGSIVEIGSGIGKIRDVIPDCILTDLFPNPWIDQVEDCYRLSFPDNSISNLILFDVFHHLEYPGTAFDEWSRVLVPNGRVIIFDPAISLLGLLVYGLCHHEPIGLGQHVNWRAPEKALPDKPGYYAAQGNATKLLTRSQIQKELRGWKLTQRKKLGALSYVASGGFRGPQLYPDRFYPLMKQLDRLSNYLPHLLATRILVVLEKQP